jgi:hypothetical protein
MVKHFLLRQLILLNRCLGIVFCLLFAMWFASGGPDELCAVSSAEKTSVVRIV